MATWGADKGVEMLTPGLYSPLMILSHKAIRTVADFHGQKIRTQGGAPIQVEPLKKVGVIPVSLPLGEALPAMQNKTIDGMVGRGRALRRLQVLRHRQAHDLPAGDDVRRTDRRQPRLAEVARAGTREDRARGIRARPRSLFSDWNIADIKAKEDIWKKNGGEVITMAPAESKRYIELVAPVAGYSSCRPIRRSRTTTRRCSRRRRSTGNSID